MAVRTPRSGITYSPLLEADLTAQWWGMGNPELFDQLSVETRARMIAAYRIQNQIGAVLAQDQARKNRQRYNKQGVGKPRG